MIELNINRKRFPEGSVVYYVKQRGFKKSVWFGTVEENYTSEICLQLYEIYDTRMINGVPIKDFKTPTRWQKLPKGWTYNTRLFEMTWEKIEPDPKNYSVKNPEDILKAISDGVLVKTQDNDHAHIETQVDNNKGWCIVRNYPYGEEFNHQTHISLPFHEVYGSYEEAQKVIEEYEAKFEQQKNMSDIDWAKKSINEELERYKRFYNISDEDIERCRERLFALDNLEDVDIRVSNQGLQWKYFKKQRWMTLQL
jgi:hypothetical protein